VVDPAGGGDEVYVSPTGMAYIESVWLPSGGAFSAPQNHLAGFKWVASWQGRTGKGMDRREKGPPPVPRILGFATGAVELTCV